MGLVAIQFEKLRLVKDLRVGKVIPGTFEAGVTGDKDGFPFVKAIKHLSFFFRLLRHFTPRNDRN